MNRALGALLALGVILTAAGLWFDEEAAPVAPTVSFQLIDGRRLELEGLRGGPVLVNFWSTSCASCVKEMPHLAALHRRWHEAGLEIVGVAMPFDPPDQVLDIARRQSLPYPVALDLDGQVNRAFGPVEVTPASFLISPEGWILMKELGSVQPERLEARIKQLLETS